VRGTPYQLPIAAKETLGAHGRAVSREHTEHPNRVFDMIPHTCIGRSHARRGRRESQTTLSVVQSLAANSEI
jgi:hypothetical protein